MAPMLRYRWLLAAWLLLVPTLTGCFYSREIVHLKRDLEREYPEARFERTVIVRVGTGTFRTLGWLIQLAPDDEAELVGGYLRDIRRVKVGVYEVDNLPPLRALAIPRLPRFQEEGWEVAVKVREDDEVAWILYRERYGTVRDLYFVVLDDEDLVVLRFEGYLQALLERALADDDLLGLARHEEGVGDGL